MSTIHRSESSLETQLPRDEGHLPVMEHLEDRILLSLVGLTPEFPLVLYNSTGVTNYAAVTDRLDVDATPLFFRQSATMAPNAIVGGTLAFDALVDSAGLLIGGVPGDDFVMTGGVDLDSSGTVDGTEPSGVLLTGEVAEFGFLEAGVTDKLDFRFTITGGSLASFYTGKDLAVTVTIENSTFTGSFDADWTGGAKGIIGTVEPEIVEQVARIGDRVWLDTNADGVQDTGETGIDGVTVNLLDGSGGFLDTTVTAGGGLYLFDNLMPGDYQMEFVVPAGYQISPQDQGIDDAVDSDADTGTGKTIVTTLVSDETDLTWDMGLYEPAGIGDRVWLDTDADGVQDTGQTGIDGVTVNLLDGSGGFLDTTVTAGGGLYLFDNLMPGDYQIEFVVPAGYQISPQDQGIDDAVDSDADTGTGKTIVTTLVSGENDLTWDMGVYEPAPEPASLGDYVWHDMYHGPGHLVDGIQDASEPGIEDVVVNLLDGSGSFLASTLTDATGFYEFTGLDAGTYIVEIDGSNQLPGNVLMAGAWYATLQDAGIDDATDSDGDPTTLRSHVVTLTEGQHDPTIDFGFFKTCIDLIKTGPEEVVAGEVITYHFRVENCGDVVLHSGAQVYDELINPNGNHLIWSGVLQPGQVAEFDRTYQTSFGLPTMDFETDAGGSALAAGTIIDDEWAAYGIHVTTNSPTNHPAMIFDSANPTGGDWDLGTPNNDFGGPGIGRGGDIGSPGANTLTLNNILIISEDGDQSDPDDNARGGALIFTFDAPVDIEAVKVLDIDCNEGGRIKAYDAGGSLIASRSIIRLGNNSYQVVDIDAEGVSKLVVCLPGSGAVTDIVFGEGDCGEIVNEAQAVGHPIHPDGHAMPLVRDTDRWTVDVLCPLSAPGSIGDRVWMDLNNNGVQDDGEPGVEDVWVDLLNANNDVVDAAVTNADGEYLFEDLSAGQYRVVFRPVEGLDFTARNVGNDATDSDADEYGETDLLTLVPGQVHLTVDAGLVVASAPSSISGFVYKDLDNDGNKDDGEKGLQCVLITLTGVDEFGNAVNLTTRTDCNGFYIFDDLAAGTYTITEAQPTGYLDGKETVGSEGGTVSNDEFSDIVLAAGVDAENYNFAEQVQPKDGCWGRRRRHRSHRRRHYSPPVHRRRRC